MGLSPAPRQALFRLFGTICNPLAKAGFVAGTGSWLAPIPRDGKIRLHRHLGQPIRLTHQVNGHDPRGARRKERGAKIVAVDIYQNGTCSRPTWRSAAPGKRWRAGLPSCTFCFAWPCRLGLLDKYKQLKYSL
jgi:hypothetical protein